MLRNGREEFLHINFDRVRRTPVSGRVADVRSTSDSGVKIIGCFDTSKIPVNFAVQGLKRSFRLLNRTARFKLEYAVSVSCRQLF